MSEENPIYDPPDIQVLRGLEAVRKRPGMYVGETNFEGIEHIVYELVANVVDQFLAGQASLVKVLVENDTITVIDDGEGLPFDRESPDKKMSLAEHMLESLHCGPTFDDHNPHIHIGQFGIGLGPCNALCLSMRIRSWREGALWSLEYCRGEKVEPPKLVKEGIGRGTIIALEVDPFIFSHIKPRHCALKKKLFETAHLIPWFKIEFNKEVYYSKGGLSDLAYFYNQLPYGESCDQPFRFHQRSENWEIQAAAYGQKFRNADWEMFFTDTTMRSWVNGTPTVHHGSHVSGFQKALFEVEWIPATLLIHVVTYNPKFSGRTRDKLVNAELKHKVYQSLLEELQSYVKMVFSNFEEHPLNH